MSDDHSFILPWEHWNNSDKRSLLRDLAAAVGPRDADHQDIEGQLLKRFPGESIDNDEFHVLVTEVYAHLARNRGVD
jgi:hypothetical protein